MHLTQPHAATAFPSGASLVVQAGKESVLGRRQEACRFDPWVRLIPWPGMAVHSGILTRKSMDRELKQATVHGVAESQTCLSSSQLVEVDEGHYKHKIIM